MKFGFASKFLRAESSVDRKHIVLECSVASESEYKAAYSTVLFTSVDSNYNFLFADIGWKGRFSDGRVFRNNWTLEKLAIISTFTLPKPHPLSDSNKDVPYILSEDGAFVLTEHVMKTYPGNHHLGYPKCKLNQRLSWARVEVENMFEILVSKFSIFWKPIQLNPEKNSHIKMTGILVDKSQENEPLYHIYIHCVEP